MLKTPNLIGEVISNMVAAVKIPVTVKIRAGWCENSINSEMITRIAEEAGAQAICIHGRTRQQAYKGPANWDYIKNCKQAAKSIKVIGNGDLLDPEGVQRMFEYTGCDAVLVARGTMGHPWIAEDIIQHLQGVTPKKRTVEDCRQALLEHFLFTYEYHHARRVAIDMRRRGMLVSQKSAGTRAFREMISRGESPEQVRELILSFPLGESLEQEEAINADADDSCNIEC